MSEADTIYQFTVESLDGTVIPLNRYRGKVVLIVNVANEMSHLSDSNFKLLRDLLDVYHKSGFEILAFSCSQFTGDDEHCAQEVARHIHKEYHFAPDIFAKIDVNGIHTHPLFNFLKKEPGSTLSTEFIRWNFTKFLIDRSGYVIGRYAPAAGYKPITDDIERALLASC